MYKQIIIVRKDLGMSIGKICSQVSHASMAFLTQDIKDHTVKIVENFHPTYYTSKNNKIEVQHYMRPDFEQWAKDARERKEIGFYSEPIDPNNPFGAHQLCNEKYHYSTKICFDTDLYEQWINGSYTKCVLQAKNKNKLLKAKTLAEDLGMKEGYDFYLIRDDCRTELTPEENGKTLTAIGFRPMESEIIDQIGKKFHLYI